jgi:hypothetical protein
VQALGEAGQRPRYGEAATYVERVAGPRDVVLERLIFPAFGEFGRPLTRHLEIQLDPRLEHVRDTRGESEGTALAAAEARDGRVLLVQPSAALPAALGPFRLTARRVWPGIEPVAVGVYAR